MNILTEGLFEEHFIGKIDMVARSAYWQKARAEGLPTARHEDWKYTRLKSLADKDFSFGKESKLTEMDLPTTHLSCRLVFVNGVWDQARTVLPTGVKVTALPANPNGTVEGFFANLAHAYSEKRISVEIEKNQNVVFELLHYLAPGQYVPLVVEGVVNEGSQVEIYETLVSAEDISERAFFLNTSMNWHLKANSVVRYYQSFLRQNSAFLQQTLCFQQDRDSQLEFFNLSAGGSLMRSDVQMYLNQPGASARMLGLYVVSGEQQADYCTEIHHVADHCTSEQLCKGLLFDHGRGVFNGLVHIHKEAQKSNASQLNKNLLLSEDAEVNTRPRLLVDADDVKAAHGATVGQLNIEEVFYLQSRGLSRQQAMTFLAVGFAKEVIFALTSNSLKDLLLDATDSAVAGLVASQEAEKSAPGAK